MAPSQQFVRVISYSCHPQTGHIEYTIHIGKNKSCVRRRFREFVQLRESILSTWESAPELPSRMFDTSPVSRLPHLDNFLNQVCETLAAKPPQSLLQFLQIDTETFAAERAATIGERAEMIIDYGTPKVPDEYKDEIERVVKEVLEASEATDGQNGWKLVGQQAPWTWMARAGDSALGYTQNRVVFGELKRCPAQLVHELFLDNEACKQMEPKMDTITDIAKLDEQTIVQFFVMKSIMYLPCRDVILIRHWRVLPNGTIVHAEFSVDEYPGVPASGEGGRVRAKLTVGGAVIAPVKGDPSACKVWRVNNMDPKLGDAIPAYAIAKLNEFTAKMLSENMFALAKMIAKKPLSESMAKLPIVNWNGKVEGAKQVDTKYTEDDILVDEKPWYTKHNVVPYIVGFLAGFSAAYAAFVMEHI